MHQNMCQPAAYEFTHLHQKRNEGGGGVVEGRGCTVLTWLRSAVSGSHGAYQPPAESESAQKASPRIQCPPLTSW